MRGRIEALAATLENLGADALLITSETNRLYYSGFNSSSGLIFAAKNGCCFMTDFRYGEAAKAKIKHMDVQIYKNRSESLKALIAEAGAKKIAIEAEKTSLSELAALQRSFPECKFITDNGLDKAIAAQRIIKSADELSKIKRAQEISEQAFLNALNHVRAGVTERDLALELEFYMRRNGASSVAFDLIVVSGENSSLPHGVPGGRALRNGDFITFDIGAVFEGYHSDMT
ncbi:MAG: Xaa-Pro peptidase family protein, partial [Oscillospiraceae bacterium]|nr:Xaa-Pro peptidase family protein [Oscillospiraceae bacterium]